MNDNWQNEQLRIQDMINKGYKYDPVTGQPLEQMVKMNSQGKKKTNKVALYIATFGGVTMLLIALSIGHIVSNLVKYADKDKPKFYVENSIDEDYFEKYNPSDDSEYGKKDIDLSYFSSFSINGNTYELPGKVQDFINSDWVFNNDNDMDTVLGYGE